MPGKVTQKHRRLAFQHAKKHVLEGLKTMFSDIIYDEHHSIIKSSDGVDLGDEVQKYLERYEKMLLRKVREDAWWTAKNAGMFVTKVKKHSRSGLVLCPICEPFCCRLAK